MHASAAVATELLKPAQPAELQVLGYTLLQHLVGCGCWHDHGGVLLGPKQA